MTTMGAGGAWSHASRVTERGECPCHALRCAEILWRAARRAPPPADPHLRRTAPRRHMKLVGTLALALAALLWIHAASTLHLPGQALPLPLTLGGVMAIAYLWWHLFGRPRRE